MKLDQKKTAKKGIKAVTRKDEAEEEEQPPQEEGAESHEWRWSDVYGHYLCVTIRSAKRPRTEEDGSSSQSTPAAGKTGGGGKAKGNAADAKGASKGQKGQGWPERRVPRMRRGPLCERLSRSHQKICRRKSKRQGQIMGQRGRQAVDVLESRFHSETME